MRNPKSRRDVIKKVIAYMTLGIDVSRLFTEMIMASSSKDVVVKKMVYQYLCTYAEQQPDLAILCINTLRNDCKDDDPVIRGLALRSMCGLRLSSIVEYLFDPLMKALRDPSPYVRKTAVVGCLKLYHVSPEIFAVAEESDEESIIDKLYTMLKDRDHMVVANTICALTEIMHDEGGMAINQPIIHHLLNRIKAFNEWGQCIVLALVAQYTPQDEAEIFSIMNLLDTCLHIANSAVVIAAAKCFIRFAGCLGPKFERQVYQRLRQPLITLTSVPSVEVDYCVYKHIQLIAARPACRGLFDTEYKCFFCRYNEPSCVKYIKLDILPFVANVDNMLEIINELSEYVTGVDAEMCRRSIKAIGRICVRLEQSVPKVIEVLLEFADQMQSFVRAETVVVLKDVLRKYPRLAKKVIPSIHQMLKQIEEPKGKAAVIWMIGEYGEQLEDGPYILESLVDDLKVDGSKAEKLELMTAAMKMFFKRAPESQQLLGTMLAAVLDPEANVDADLHDRALLFVRLLKEDVGRAASVVAATAGSAVRAFAEGADSEAKERVFKEFNTLSVLYEKPAESFISESHMTNIVHAGAPDSGEGKDEDEAEVEAEAEIEVPAAAAVAIADNSASMGNDGGDDLLDLDDLMGGEMPDAPIVPAALELLPKHKIVPKTFQAHWTKTKKELVVQADLASQFRAAALEAALKAGRIFCLMSGVMKGGKVLKYFFYATDAEKNFYMIKLLFEKRTCKIKATCKSQSDRLDDFTAHFKGLLGCA